MPMLDAEKNGTSFWYQMPLEAKLLMSEANLADENRAEIDVIAAACFIAATSTNCRWNKLNSNIIYKRT